MTNELDGLSLDLESTNKDKLKSIFPECFSEGMLDIDKLLSLCGEYIDNDFEKYKFEWKGKAECLRLAQKHSTGTLRPCCEESVNFDDTENLYIEGDNLEVLKLLQAAYYRKVKLIYIDPPYNTGNDFVYEDNFADPMARYKEVTQQTTKSNPETMGRFHTNWLNMMYPRLRLAANLLIDDGVIFISIDDNEITNMRRLCDEVFGEENFVSTITWEKRYSPQNAVQWFSEAHDFILVYAKFKEIWQPNLLERSNEMNARYRNLDNDPRGDWKPTDATAQGGHGTDSQFYELVSPSGKSFSPPAGRCWVYTQERMQEMIGDNRVWFGSNGDSAPALKRFLSEVKQGVACQTIWKYQDVGHNQEGKKEIKILFPEAVPFDTPKPTRLIKRIVQLAANKDDIVLDFFSGSATTAHAVMQLNAQDGGNRKFICVQLPEVTDEKSEAYKAGYKNICEIGKERIRRAGKSITYQTEEQKKVLEDTLNQVKLEFGEDSVKPIKLDIGFKVFKLDTSNLREWDSTPVADNDINLFYQRLNDMVDSIKPDRTAMDVVYEVMLKMGIPLDVPVTYMEVNGKVAYVVGDLLLLICFAETLTAEDIEAMAEYAPAKMILAEQSFADDTALSNAHYILRDKQIELKLV